MELDVEKKSVPHLSKIPDHLKPLVDNSAINLNKNQQEQLEKFILEYVDVFAENEFNLGNFKEIAHSSNADQTENGAHTIRL